MPKINYPSPPKVQDTEKFNEYIRRLHILIQGSGSVSSGSQDSENVNFAEAENRDNHTGTQTASTVSDFDESVETKTVDLIDDGEALTWTSVSGSLTGEVTKMIDPGAATTTITGTADLGYGAVERDMLNASKTDLEALRDDINAIRTALQTAKLST